MLVQGCVLLPSWCAGGPGGSSAGLRVQKPAAIQCFFLTSGVMEALPMLTYLSLYWDSAWEQSYCLTAPMQKKKEKEKKESSGMLARFLLQLPLKPMSFFFIQSRAHFSYTAFWNVLQINYCKEMHINIYIYMNIVYSTQSYLLFLYIYEL